MAEVAGSLNNPACRMLTLLGPGGSGKTRLAIQCAALEQENFRDGVHFVPLAALRSADDILGTLAEALAFQLYARAEMQHSLEFLVTNLRNEPERHQSMRAVFNHSWRLLGEEERKVFEKLSIIVKLGCALRPGLRRTGSPKAVLALSQAPSQRHL